MDRGASMTPRRERDPLATRRRRRTRVGALTAVVAAAFSVLVAVGIPPTAVAQGLVPLGGGSGIVVDGAAFCTLTAIGHDNRGSLVGLTSAHCGGPGALVAAENAEDAGVLGTMVAGNDTLDYAVIEFDPQKVAPVKVVDGFQIDSIGPDPGFGAVACKLGRTTGHSCGVTWGPGDEPGTIVSQVCGLPGDSGAPVTVNNRLVGMLHGAYTEELPTCIVKFVPLHTPAVAMSVNAQLADIAAKGRPGSGFVPIGA